MDLSKLNWKAIGIGAVIAIVVELIPLIGFLGPIAGGIAVVYFAKTKDNKEGMTYGAITGFIASLITAIISGLAAKAMLAKLSTSLPIAGLAISSILGAAIIVSIILGIVLGLVGGIIGVAIFKKK